MGEIQQKIILYLYRFFSGSRTGQTPVDGFLHATAQKT